MVHKNFENKMSEIVSLTMSFSQEYFSLMFTNEKVQMALHKDPQVITTPWGGISI